MSSSRHPYPPTPAVQARNDAQRAVLALVDELATSALHASRAKVSLAGLVPPPGVATDRQVRDAVAATTPGADATAPIATEQAAHRAHLEVVR